MLTSSSVLLRKVNDLRGSLEAGSDARSLHALAEDLMQEMSRLKCPYNDSSKERTIEEAVDACKLGAQSVILLVQRIITGEDSEHATSELGQTLEELHFLLSELCTYDSEERDLVSEVQMAIEEVKRNLAAVADTTMIVDLTSRFKNLIEAVEKMEIVTSRLPLSTGSEVIKSQLYCLKLSLPILCSSMQRRIKYPGYDVELLSTNLIEETEKNLDRSLSCVRSIADSNQFQAGHFVGMMDKLLESLSTENFQQLDNDIFERNISTTLKHAMIVADFSSHLYNEDIQSVCCAIEDGKRDLTELLNRTESPDTDASSVALNDQREFLVDNLMHLENMVNEAIVFVVVDALCEPINQSNMESMASDINLACHLALASCSETDHIVEISSASNRANLLWRLIKIVSSSDRTRLIKEWEATITKLTWSLDRTINLLLFITIIDELILDEYYEINHTSDAVRGLSRILLMANRVMQAANMKQLQNKEFNVLLQYLKSALILLRELNSRPLNREELKFRVGVIHTCMVSLRKWLEDGSGKRNHRDVQSGIQGNRLQPPILEITSMRHVDEQLPEGVNRLLSRPPPYFDSRSTPELLNNARSFLPTPQEMDHQLVTDDVELRDLIRQAMDGYQTRVNLLGNDVVSRSNKLVILAKRMVAAVCDEELKSKLDTRAKNLTALSPKLLETVDLVVHGDVSMVPLMYKSSNEWSQELVELQSIVLPLIQTWMAFVMPILEAAEKGSFQELSILLQEFSAFWGRLDFTFKELELAIGKSFASASAQQCVRAISADLRQMEEEAKQLSDEANKVAVNSAALRGVAESWSTSALCLYLGLVRLFRLLSAGISLDAPESPSQFRQSHIDRVTRHCLLESARMHATVEDFNRVDRDARRLLDRISKSMKNTDQLLTVLDAEKQSYESGIADCFRLASVQRFWAAVCQILAESFSFDHFVDQMVEEYTKVGLRLIGAAVSTNTNSDDARSDYSVLRQHFATKWIEVQGEIISMVEDLDMSVRADIRSLTDELGQLGSRLADQTNAICHVCTEEALREVLFTNRRWACKMDLLVNGLLSKHPNRGKIIVMVKQMSSSSTSLIRMDHYENVAEHKWTELRHTKDTSKDVVDGPSINDSSARSSLVPNAGRNVRPRNPHAIRFPRITNSITFDKIANALEHATDKWEDDRNQVVRVAKEMSSKLSNLLSYMRGEGPIESRDELLLTAREIAKDASEMIDFAKIIAKFAVNEESQNRLISQANMIAMPAAQLSIVARVKESFTLDPTSARQVATTAENLMRAVSHTLQAAEACCVHGVNTEAANPMEQEALAVTTRWVSRLQRHYRHEVSDSRVDELGLRQISLNQTPPHLSDMFLQR